MENIQTQTQFQRTAISSNLHAHPQPFQQDPARDHGPRFRHDNDHEHDDNQHQPSDDNTSTQATDTTENTNPHNTTTLLTRRRLLGGGLHYQPATSTEDPDPKKAKDCRRSHGRTLRKMGPALQATLDVQTKTSQNMMKSQTNSTKQHLMTQLRDVMNFRDWSNSSRRSTRHRRRSKKTQKDPHEQWSLDSQQTLLRRHSGSYSRMSCNTNTTGDFADVQHRAREEPLRENVGTQPTHGRREHQTCTIP